MEIKRKSSGFWRKPAKNQPGKEGFWQARKYAKTPVKSAKNGQPGGVSGTDYKNSQNKC
jgi:hypothetical protein